MNVRLSKKRKAIAFCFLLAGTYCKAMPAAFASVTLAPIFSDHMVIQRDKPIHIFGKSDKPGESITVKLGKQSAETKSREDGDWDVFLSPVHAREEMTLSVSGENSITFTDVKAGDVWVFAGQSNMIISLSDSDVTPERMDKIKQSSISYFRFWNSSFSLGAEQNPTWGSVVENDKVKGSVAAIPTVVASSLSDDQKIPIGIIVAACGGAPIESFFSKETADKFPVDPATLQEPYKISSNFDEMLAPLTPISIKGMVWYQGEANVTDPKHYRDYFPACISDWRVALEKKNLPFYFVQLPQHGVKLKRPTDSFWADLREAQTMALALPKTYMITSIDTVKSNPASMHPREKTVIADRLANAILQHEYRRNLSADGPGFRRAKIADGKIIVTVETNGQGLRVPSGALINGFQIAADDHKFVVATAKIIDDQIEVSNSLIANPVAVRYAWTDNPSCSVYSRDLPLPPFRTDDWPTEPKMNPADVVAPTTP